MSWAEEFTPADATVFQVGIAEQAISDGSRWLACYGLGSCVAIALLDTQSSVGGLVHVMLPSSGAVGGGGPTAKFADTGCRALVDSVVDNGGNRETLVAKIVGGSEMFEFEGISREVGKRNVAAVKATLADLNVEIIAEDIGGDHGRSVAVDVTRNRAIVTTADNDIREL